MLNSCDYILHKHQVGIVAELNGNTLNESDLYPLTAGLSKEDSAMVAEQYIRQWAINILRYEKALGGRDDELEAMVEDYRRSLYLYEYEQNRVKKKMPKNIADSTIKSFYEEHKDQFILRESIVKGILLVIPQKSPKQDKLKKLLANPTQDNLEKIEKYAYQYSSGYELFVDNWRTTNEIILRLPLEKDILQSELKQRALIEVNDENNLYLLQVTDKHLVGDYQPLDYAKEEIKQIILSQRQVDFLKEEREKLYEEALRYKKLRIYGLEEK